MAGQRGEGLPGKRSARLSGKARPAFCSFVLFTTRGQAPGPPTKYWVGTLQASIFFPLDKVLRAAARRAIDPPRTRTPRAARLNGFYTYICLRKLRV